MTGLWRKVVKGLSLCCCWCRQRTPRCDELRAGPGVALVFAALLTGCVGVPEGVRPVSGFEVERYLGRWYEIARLDYHFERGLESVSAHYSLREDGAVRVLNRGFDTGAGRWREAEGVARLVADADQGHLKVSFFGPFYASYVVFGLDPGYEHAFVAGYNRDYLWLLAREPQVEEAVKARFVALAGELGFAVEALHWVDHTRPR